MVRNTGCILFPCGILRLLTFCSFDEQHYAHKTAFVDDLCIPFLLFAISFVSWMNVAYRGTSLHAQSTALHVCVCVCVCYLEKYA